MSRTTALEVRDLPSENSKQWYIVASHMDAAVYVNGQDRTLHLVDRFSNPRCGVEQAPAELGKEGIIRYSLDQPSHHHHELASLRFAKKIAKFIMAAYHERRFGNLVLVAEPRFLSLLRRYLSPVVQRAVEFEARSP